VHDLVRQTARRRLSIVGHSMGATVAAGYAATYADRVEKPVLLEGLGPPQVPVPVGPRRAQPTQ
jgi:pimeloyl-ACP methyl ester carboxylesterase